MKIAFALVQFALACALGSCASGPDVGCQAGIDAEGCFKHCAQFASCSECAAQPSCGYCGPAPGFAGACLPALHGEDRRSIRPDSRCESDWFFRTADPEVPPGAPFCPAIAAPAANATSSGGEQ